MTRIKLATLLLRCLQSPDALLKVNPDTEIPGDVHLYGVGSGSPVLRVRFEHETFHIICNESTELRPWLTN